MPVFARKSIQKLFYDRFIMKGYEHARERQITVFKHMFGTKFWGQLHLRIEYLHAFNFLVSMDTWILSFFEFKCLDEFILLDFNAFDH